MDNKQLMSIFTDTAYVRTGGSPQELKCAQYLQQKCKELGLNAQLEPFKVPVAYINSATLEVDGKVVECKGYLCCGSGTVEAPLYYLTNTDSYSLSLCKGKIVMIDTYLRHWVYQDLLKYGAVGFITYDGNANYSDCDIDHRELRKQVHNGNRLLGVNINAKSAIDIINSGVTTAKITIDQVESEADSHNVVLDIPGEIDQTIVFTAHYDSTSLSQGAYDNMTGSVGILAIAEYFASHPHRHSLRFVWCGSEERGLLGAKAYCADHKDELDNIVLNINLDMIGSIMGNFIACCTSEEKLVHYIQYFAKEVGRGITARQDVYSSDSTPFADNGIPAVSFARLAPSNTATIHNSYDTMAVIKAEHIQQDIDFIIAFANRMANAVMLPVERTMPDNMKDKLDLYLCRRRDKR